MDDIILKYWRKLPVPVRNKYFLTAVIFVAFMVFFDRHDILTNIRLQKSVDKLEQDKVFYEDQIEAAKQERLEMEINKERFARESYFMQRNKEDVFIITEEE